MIPFWKTEMPKIEDLIPHFSSILESGNVSARLGGKYILEVEEFMRNYSSRKHAVVTSSATSALTLLLSYSLFKGRTILMPSFTFSATMAAAQWNHLPIRFIDIDPDTWTIDANIVKKEAKSGDIILAVNMFGNPPDYDALKIRGTTLLSDSAQSLGSKYKDRNAGSEAYAEVFSFSPTKLVSAGEGGCLVTDNRDLYEHILHGRHHGDSGNYNPSFPGMNAKMTEFQAAILLEGLKDLKNRVLKHQVRAVKYGQALLGYPITLQKTTQAGVHTYKEFTILVPATLRNKISAALKEGEVDHRRYWSRPLHMTHSYTSYELYQPVSLPVTEKLSRKVISLPMHAGIGGDEITHICDIIKRTIDEN